MAGMIVQRKKPIALRQRVIGVQFQFVRVAGQGLVESAQFAMDLTHVIVGIPIIRLNREHFLVGRQGLVGPMRLAQGDRQVVSRIGKIRLRHQRGAISFNCFLASTGLFEGIAEVEERDGMIREFLEGKPIRFDRLGGATLVHEGVAAIEMRFRVVHDVHRRHISRNAFSKFAANFFPSMRGDFSILWRSPFRSSLRAAKFPANLTVFLTNSSGSCATRAASSPRFLVWLNPARETAVCPQSVATGTPIQNASRLVVWPLYGKVSRQRSIRW